jgi:sarcosine oxidase subunit beta
LATAYYLAKNHGISNVAVLEKGWIGGGNTGRNTTLVRSNYLYEQSAKFYDFSLRLYEGLSRELNYNIMLSQRGVLMLAHNRHELEFYRRWVSAMQVGGIDSELLTTSQIQQAVPLLNCTSSARFPIRGGFIQHRAGVARHDAVAWGYARGADGHGVDIIQQCEVKGFGQEAGGDILLETSSGIIRAGRVGLAAAGHSSVLAKMAGVHLPI